MLPPVLSPESLRLVERFDAAFQLARMQAAGAQWSEQGVEAARFGGLTAIRAKGEFLRHKCLILGLSRESVGYLRQATGFFREAGLGCALTLTAAELDDSTFDALVAAGMRCIGTAQAMARVPSPQEAVAGVDARFSPPEERDLYLDLYRRGFATEFTATDETLRWQWLNDTLPGAQRCVAETEGRPAGMASLITFERVGYLATCGVLPEFRRRGVHGALIRARVAASFTAGCDLVLGGGALFGAPMRNYGRHGFELLPLGTVWSLAP